MPELPEVETIARDVRRLIVGATVERVEVRRADIVRPLPTGARPLACLAGRSIRDVSRRGKVLLVGFDGPTLAIHLGMTGQVVVAEAETPVPPHTHVVLHLRDGRQVRFRDARRFGHVSLALDGAPPACVKDLGPEPLDLDAAALAAILARHNRQMKPLLLDQHCVAGIGNIYADEILFRAGVHPLTPSRALRPPRVRALSEAMHAVLDEAISHNGTTISDYVTGRNVPGEFQAFLRVYGRTGEPCVRCGRRIVRLVVGQRGTHVCPKCQKAPANRGGQ